MKKNSLLKNRASSLLPPRPASSNVLDDIHQKIYNSTALNGGFETLLHKIDKIEHGQGQLASKVDKIHEAIFDPNDGVFSRLADYKLENSQKFSEISQHMSEINEWKKHQEKSDNKNEVVIDTSSEKLHSLEKTVTDLEKSKNNTWAVMKWALVAIGGGLVTLFFGWLESKLHLGH